MHSKPPFVAQERSEGCVLACLRMILAQHDRHVTEDELAEALAAQKSGTTIEELGGVDIEDVPPLAEEFGLRAEIRELPLSVVANLLRQERFPILYVYRLPIEGIASVHALIPLRITKRYVTVLDPLRGERRISVRKFERARGFMANWGVICELL